MWIFYFCLYIILSILCTQYFKIATKSAKKLGELTVLLESIAGLIVLFYVPLFKFKFPTDYKIYILLFIACVFYAITDRTNTVVRSGVEASTFSMLKQLSVVFMIMGGIFFLKEPFVLRKIIGSALIIFSNIFIFYKKGKMKFDKYVIYGILANITFSIALLLDVNNSVNFNLPFYVAITLLFPALIIFTFERLKPINIINEFKKGDKKSILITSFCWGTMIVTQLKAYQLCNISIIAPLSAVTVIINVIVAYIFFNERTHLLKKIIAAIIIILGIILIKI